jgi:hypothetical protein
MPDESRSQRLEMYRVSARWNRNLDPVRFVEKGDEPPFSCQPVLDTP